VPAVQAVGLHHGTDRARLPRARTAARVRLPRRVAGAGQGQPARAVARACRLRIDRGTPHAAHLHRRVGARRPRSQENVPMSAAQTASRTSPLVEVRNLSVEFRSAGNCVEAVKRVSFNIAKGEIVALVGESGSGKSVSALSILRLLPYPAAHHPTGEIRYAGQDMLKACPRSLREGRGDKISMIFQEPMTSLNPLHTILKQVGEVMRLHQGVDDATVRERVLSLLRKVGLNDPEKRLNAYPYQLSGGQRQRVMIAMALAN